MTPYTVMEFLLGFKYCTVFLIHQSFLPFHAFISENSTLTEQALQLVNAHDNAKIQNYLYLLIRFLNSAMDHMTVLKGTGVTSPYIWKTLVF